MNRNTIIISDVAVSLVSMHLILQACPTVNRCYNLIVGIFHIFYVNLYNNIIIGLVLWVHWVSGAFY